MNTHELAKILLQMPDRTVDDNICCEVLSNESEKNESSLEDTYEAAINIATVDETVTVVDIAFLPPGLRDYFCDLIAEKEHTMDCVDLLMTLEAWEEDLEHGKDEPIYKQLRILLDSIDNTQRIFLEG